MLKQKIVELKGEIIIYSDHVIKMVEKSLKGLKLKDRNILNEVIKVDELVANKFEIKIDELCTGAIALFQPEAKDLRTILSILKINNDLERIGDLAVNIAEASKNILYSNSFDSIFNMGHEVLNMLDKGVNAFIKSNIEIANVVLKLDDIVDQFQMKIDDSMIKLIKNNNNDALYGFNIIKIAASLERIADMATNICEEVIYINKGQIVKHKFNI